MRDNQTKPASSDASHTFGVGNVYASMYQMIFGYSVSQIVHTAARYSLAEHLATEPATAEDIAHAESLDVAATFRFMRTCASLGLLAYDGTSKFSTTPLLDTLHKDNANSLRGSALLMPASGHWLPWGQLSEAIKTGKPQAVATLGRNAWEHLADRPDEAAAFADAIRGPSMIFNRDAATLIDTGSSLIAVDIGGASGTLVHSLMRANPALQGVVFDLPHVVPSAIADADKLGLQDRFSVVPGDFFNSDLPTGDLFLLKLILHDWDDQTCRAILMNCRKAINPGGRIVVVEMLMGDVGAPGMAPLMDLNMLVVLGGKERHLDEYKALLSDAGFSFSKVTPTSTPFSLIEAVAA